jgi:ABC-type nitrate/sulfonate/bicarbonate transport system substrate-binding protein
MISKILASMIFILAVSPAPAEAQLKKVRLAIPTVDIVTLPLKMAQARGFYQKEGLEVEIILIAGALGVQAVLGNSVEFSTASGSILAAAARGVPVKLVSVITAKPTFDLISEPKIQSFGQLKGKLVGISTRGGTFEHITRLILERNGLHPDKDVTILALGRQDDIHLGLKAGRISAAIFSPPRSLLLYRDGFHKLAVSGDYLPHYPIGGLGVTDELIKKNPADFRPSSINDERHRLLPAEPPKSIKFIPGVKMADNPSPRKCSADADGAFAEGRPNRAWINGVLDHAQSLEIAAPISRTNFRPLFVDKSGR